MRHRLRRLGFPLAAALLMACVGPAGAARAERSGSAGRSAAGPTVRATVVTLVTGDRVVLSGADGMDVGVVPGEGRRHVSFHTHRKAGKLRVIPSDVEVLVASGRLDARLFDVTGLIEAGYDDSKTKSIPLIVTYDGTAGRVSVRGSGAEVVRELPSVNGSAVRVVKGRGFGLVSGQRLAGGVERVWLDGVRRTVLDQSVPQIGAPAAWRAGYTGKGVTVAVLDTGVDASHPDLAGRAVEAKNFTRGPAGDQVGHGTHVASTIAGTAAASAGKYKGVAPDAVLLDGKVCEAFGCLESAILAGMQWAASEKRADVINVSLGGGDTPEVDPLEEAVNTLTAQTASLFVIAAGNDGFAESVNSPGSADAALTVGAVDKSDELAPFSSRGPRVGDAGVKPDVTAPGVDIVAARSRDGRIGEPVGEHYVRLSGTSMATPHTAGAAALLAQQHPDWAAGELKAVLMASAKSHAGQGIFDQGAGRIDVAKAITQTVFAQPGSLSFGTARWPHDDDEPVVRQLTYRNTGSAAITLALRAELSGPAGVPAPAGALMLSASSVTVPAGGTAAVTVTSNTRHGGPAGIYTGRVTATGPGDLLLTVPLSVDLEPERYDLTVTHLDPDGTPTGRSGTWITGIDNDIFTFAQSPDGVAKVRLPKGRYLIRGRVSIDRGNGRGELHTLMQPVLLVDKDSALTVDARRTKPVQTTIPRADARLHYYSQAGVLNLGGVSIGDGVMTFEDLSLFTAPLGEPVPAGQFSALLHSVWGVEDEFGRMLNSPYSYHLMNTQKGQYWHGFTRTVRDSELAVIPVRHHWTADGRLAEKLLFGRNPDGIGMPAFSQLYTPPVAQTQLVDAGGNSWRGEYWDLDSETLVPIALQGGRYRAYSAGRNPLERWNAAVIGPGMQPFHPGVTIASRVGDQVLIFVPNHSDGDGHGGISFGSGSDPGSAELYCNGELIEGWTEDFMVPSGRCDFRHVVTTSRSNSTFSTRIDMDSTFSSQTASPEGEPLPMWAVRYRPAVDMRNTMERQPITVLPVELEPQPGAKVGSLTRVEVQVSGDDGTTWTKAAVRRTGANRYVAVFATPAGDYVSLKGKAADSDRNTTEQTIIRAYALR